MNLVLGIVFGAVLIGLFAPRLRRQEWVGIGGWIFLLIAYYLIAKRNG